MPTTAAVPLNTQEIYDENFYRANNPDLASLNSRDLYQHFLNFGINQGRKFSPFFDVNFYRAANPELTTTTTLTNRQLFDNFLNEGLARGRQFSQFFDLDFYRASNPDLANLDNFDLFRHFRNFGVAEGFRSFSPVLDLNFYQNNNPDLAGLNYRQLFEQFQLSGLAQGREFSPYFDIDIYRSRNADLPVNFATNQQLLENFLLSGIDQGRDASLFFNISEYRDKNADLSRLNNRELFEHFQTTGLPQGRPFSLYFDLSFYQDGNRDLGTLNNKQLWEHFQNFGLRENRPFSPFLDLEFYRSRNPDLGELNNRELAEQLITAGLDQGRPLSPFFDLNYYRASNGLQALSNRELWLHLQNVGVPGGLALSPFFDLNLYRNSNPDLARLTNEQLFEHFQNFGLNEGRTFSPVIDLNVYRNSNPDLTGLSNRDLFEILVTTGIGGGGGTAATQFFDPDFYRRSNFLDLANLDDTQLLEHFQNFGLNEDRKFSPYLDLEYYGANNPDLLTAGVDTRRELYDHFQRYGLNEGRPFSQFFDVRYYLDNNPDLRGTGMNFRQAFAHFQNSGVNEGRRPSILFNPVYYLANNPDLAARGLSFKQAFEDFQLSEPSQGIRSGFQQARPASVLFTPNDIAPLVAPPNRNSDGPVAQWLQSAARWGNIPANGILTYSFVSTASAFLYEGTETGIREVSDAVKNNVRDILRKYDEVMGINVIEVPDNPPNVGRIRIMLSDGLPSLNIRGNGYAYAPSDVPGSGTAGDVHLNAGVDFSQGPGSFNYETLLSIIGTALGLEFPDKQTEDAAFEPILALGKDNDTNTVMTGNNSSTRYTGSFASTPMSYDIRALQYLYGAGYLNNTDTTYRFDFNNFIGPNQSGGRNGVKQTVFDSGGIDTFDFSALPSISFGYYFDMNEGGQNTTQLALNGATYSIPNPDSTETEPLPPTVLNTNSFGTTLAFGFDLENLIGSQGNDEILGNNLSNNIAGGGGDDRINSASGRDILNGGPGNDIFVVARGQGSLNPELIDTITDFTDGQDRIGLALGLTFPEIRIVPGTNPNDTLIRLANTGEYLAVLTGVPSTAITVSDFTAV